MTQPATAMSAVLSPITPGSVFISYAHLDDERPPGRDDVAGWVTYFWGELRFELTQVGVGRAALWLDRYQIEKAEKFTPKIEAALADARVILPILSPNWADRDWCKKEVTRFTEQQVEGRDLENDVVPVFKTEIPPTVKHNLPPILLERQGYEFFRREPTGRLSEFYWRGLRNELDYLELVKEIALRIRDRFYVDPPPSPEPIRAARGRTVFVAVPTDELRDAWLRLVNDLRADGFTVLPMDDRLPDTAAKVEEEVCSALRLADLAVYLLGESDGVIPVGGTEGIVRQQLGLARTLALAGQPLPRILWAPKWLPDAQVGKRDPFKVIGRYDGLKEGEQVYAEPVTELSQWLRDLLGPRGAAPSTLPSVFIAGVTCADDQHVGMLANALQLAGRDVEALFAGAPTPARPAQPGMVLLAWGDADEAALVARLEALESLGRRAVLRLPGADEAARARFFRKGIVSLPMRDLPADRAAALALLRQLEPQ
jgi:hypothetical protein